MHITGTSHVVTLITRNLGKERRKEEKMEDEAATENTYR
jgi:hypothetical protein